MVNEQKEENIEYQIPEKNINLLKFIKYLFYCKRKNTNISYIEEYREKIVSEESMIHGDLDLLEIKSFYKQKENNDDNISIENLNVNYDRNNLQLSNNC